MCLTRTVVYLALALKGDDETSKDRFVIGALYANERNTIPYLAFDSIKNYRASKMGVLQRFLRDVQTWLAPYLTLEIMSLDESTHIGMKSSKNSMLGIRKDCAKFRCTWKTLCRMRNLRRWFPCCVQN